MGQLTIEEDIDRWFSYFIRLNSADPHTGLVHCYTCPTIGYWKEFDCGHFQRRGIQSIRWDKNNARPQCPICNQSMNGRPDIFEEELRDEIGDKEVERLLNAKDILTKVRNQTELELLLIHYRMAVKSNPLFRGVV